MTDEQIIRALEICANDGDCKDCAINPHKGNYGYCTSLALKAALDLINRQKAEIENYSITEKDLRYRNKEFEKANKKQAEYIGELESELRAYTEIRAKAIKEFAERLKEKIDDSDVVYSTNYDIVMNYIDNLVKEMTEGDNDKLRTN